MIIHHVTLMTGHTVTHRLDTLAPEAVDACRSLLPDGGPIPGFSPFFVVVQLPVFTIFRGREPIVTCGIGRGDNGCWSALVNLQTKFAPVTVDAPVGQWLAAALLPALGAISRYDLGWLGDFERCMAAAILLPR